MWRYQRDAISEGGGLLSIFVVTSIKAHVVGVACCAILGQSGKFVYVYFFFVVTPAMLATLVNVVGPK